MKQLRLEIFADGVFAIAITLLVIHIRLPELSAFTTDDELWAAIVALGPAFASYLLSFSVLFTYWRAHHFIVSMYAKGVDQMFANINAAFLFFIVLVPFLADTLGRFGHSALAVILFSLNVIALGGVLFWMRSYAKHTVAIKNPETSEVEERHAMARILVPVLLAVVAIILVPWGTTLSLAVLTLGILFNLSRRSTRVMFKTIGTVVPQVKE